MGFSTPTEAIVKFRKMLADMEIGNPTSAPSHHTSDIEILSKSVNPIRLKNNPVKLDEEIIYALYKKIVK